MLLLVISAMNIIKTMIPDLLFVIIASLVGLIALLLAPLRWVFPFSLTPAFTWLFTPLRLFGSFIDLHFLGQVLSGITTFLILWYSYQLIRFIVSLVRPHVEQPEA